MKRLLVYLLLLSLCSIAVYSQKTEKPDYLEKIREKTPPPLPQKPVVKRLTSDAQNDNLRGKVKSVIVEKESLTGYSQKYGRVYSSIADFDTQGNYLKQVEFESEGRPVEIAVYGYIDNQRVSRSNYITYDDFFRTDSSGANSQEGNTTKPDTRYELKYEFRYENGKLSERQVFNNRGSKKLRYVYNYKGNQIERLSYMADGELFYKNVTIFDKKGNEIEIIDFDVDKPQMSESDRFKYENVIFDKKGNWIKRTLSELEVENGKEVYKPNTIEYRTITYYP